MQSGSKCIADLCGALHCDHVMHTKSRKTKCNPVAVARNRHICEVALCAFVASLVDLKDYTLLISSIFCAESC